MNGWVNNREAGNLRRHRGHYDVNVMHYELMQFICPISVGWFHFANMVTLKNIGNFDHCITTEKNTTKHEWSLLLIWFNFDYSMDK